MAEETIVVEPVSDADVDAFYRVFFARPDELEHIPLVGLDANSPNGRFLIERYKQAIENDRTLVAERRRRGA